ncbi:MAG: glycosyltransferase [Cyanobium sp. M30B3]|nr:MAG: glycosyltransferase [Cyanobium sp. M30B3]
MSSFQPALLQVCTYPGAGGAGVAAARLVDALAGSLPSVELLGLPPGEGPHHPRVRSLAYGHSPLEAVWRRLRVRQCRSDQAAIQASDAVLVGFFSDRSPHGWALAQALQQPELIHLHWVNDLLDYARVLPLVPASVPVVWTLHDMSAFTGGCCYALDCVRFQTGCGCCPQLASRRPGDLSARSLARRARALRAICARLHLIAPSAWMARMAASSRLFAGLPCTVIPNAVDLACFHPHHRDAGRAQLGLAPTTALLLFVAASVSNPVKGMATLLAALPQLQGACPVPLAVACIGSRPEALPAGVRWLGRIDDPDQLAGLYAAADLLVVSSLIDNAPNVIAEAHACGLPVLASAVGGIPEMIEPGRTGALVPPADSAALAVAASALLPAVMAERPAWSARCRAAAEGRYAPDLVASRHLDLYRHALEQVGGHQPVTPS